MRNLGKSVDTEGEMCSVEGGVQAMEEMSWDRGGVWASRQSVVCGRRMVASGGQNEEAEDELGHGGWEKPGGQSVDHGRPSGAWRRVLGLQEGV